MSNKNITWEDETEGSYLVCLKEYGVTLNKVTKKNGKTILAVSGNQSDIENLIEDIESGDVHPLCDKRDLSDEEYDEWLSNEIAKNK